jgi:hypothetical protein
MFYITDKLLPVCLQVLYFTGLCEFEYKIKEIDETVMKRRGPFYLFIIIIIIIIIISVNYLKMEINVNYIYRFRFSRALNTLHLDYKN